MIMLGRFYTRTLVTTANQALLFGRSPGEHCCHQPDAIVRCGLPRNDELSGEHEQIDYRGPLRWNCVQSRRAVGGENTADNPV
jgi:hypothetical protein